MSSRTPCDILSLEQSFVDGDSEAQKSVVEELRLGLKSSDEEVRYNSISVLKSLGVGAFAPLVSELTDALSDENAGASWIAAELLGELGADAKPAVPKLTEALRHQEPGMKFRAAEALCRIGEASPNAVSILIDSLADESSRVKSNVKKALSKLGASHLELLHQRIADPNSEIRSGIALALGKLTNKSDATIKALITLLFDEVEGVRSNAVNSLADLDSESVVMKLLNKLEDKSPNNRAIAAWALSMMKLKKEEICMRLEQLGEKDPEAIVRKAAYKAIRKISSKR